MEDKVEILNKSTNTLFNVDSNNLQKLGEKDVNFDQVLEVVDDNEKLLLCRKIIQETINDNQFDPNFDQTLIRRAIKSLVTRSLENSIAIVEEIKLEAALFNESPYAEVRAAVSIDDDPTEYVDTFRAWFLGLGFAIAGTFVNTFFAARNPAIVLNTFCAQVLSYPLAKGLEYLPTTKFKILGKECSLNPGPFNRKEHMLITIMANVSFGGIGVYMTDVFYVQRLHQFFNQNIQGSKAGYQILLTLSTQLIGFSLAGLSRRFIVYPARMIWPSNLASIVLNSSFHTQQNEIANGWKISKLKFFLFVFVGYGIYFILPDVLLSVLSNFNWITWIAPSNVILALICGNTNGLGLNPWPTFDWSYATTIANPLISPLFSTLNQFCGMILIAFPVIIGIYFTNTFQSAYLPINSNHIYDNTGEIYNVTRILNDDGFSLNVTAYQAYSPLYQSAANATSFFFFFAIVMATLVHTILYHYSDIKAGLQNAFKGKGAREEFSDIHNKLMSVYTEVPEWYFGAVLSISLLFGILANEVYETGLPMWALFFNIAMGAVLLIPVGTVAAVSNVIISLNVVAEVVAGAMLPGKPLAVMIFKSYGIMINGQAIQFASDMKLAHYAKIPPQSTFWAQLIATIVSVAAALLTAAFQIQSVKGLCEPNQVSKFSCPGYNTFFTSASQWGLLGTVRLYGPNGAYNTIMYGFLFGALIPFPVYYLSRKYPSSIFKFISTPVILYGASNFSPYNLSYIIPPLYLAVIFQGYIKKYYSAWWNKYTYILSSALTSAISIFGVLWFFTILYKPSDALLNWVGNSYGLKSADSLGTPLRSLVAGQTFGPAIGEF